MINAGSAWRIYVLQIEIETGKLEDDRRKAVQAPGVFSIGNQDLLNGMHAA